MLRHRPGAPALFILSALALCALLGSLAVGQERPGRPSASHLKVLKPDQIRPAMRGFTQGLGVGCDYCHVSGAFDRDDKPTKAKALQMLRMVNDINKKYRITEGKVNCAMCHRGRPEPSEGAEGGPRRGGRGGDWGERERD
ncbi:MAG: photosynthetic reaction center cytochrome c subunit family protein [Armatimonadetes bacterium]|nr:photosynthetic reaction center cytochrome c subunit family protein [Armatimonadota bacterium]